ncbi:hypothetical protein [Streptomyces sp. WM6386]|uniref:hypothetical protein n=1 Tax=Streptomyces sp. WM6386 TaxID=1415558 RepID=UPI0006197499|nr:hypothetical protein [Streptomyces sp. WM6386]KKD09390.1 hypothetical protein TN53_02540 [Streptomyces sp. WM6386]
MAVSLGRRISGLLVVGAVAVAAAAFTGDGSDTSDRGDGGGTIVTVGPSGRAPAGRTGSPSPLVPAQPRPDGQVISPAAPPVPLRSPDASPAPAPAPSPSASKSPLDIPVWLPPGPDSPDADGIPDPSGVYDGLRAPTECRTALEAIPGKPADDEWRLLRGLASACLAVQGKGGSWETASRDFAALVGKSDTCKGRAGYTVLGGLLDFHRRHPTATVRLQAASGGTPACAYAIAGVDSGDDGQARPGETVGVELAGTYFDHAELLRNGRVFIDGQQLEGPPVLASEAGDHLVLNVVVPVVEGLPRAVDVAVRFGGVEVRAQEAFTVVAPAPTVSEPETPTASVAPQGVFPLRPLPAHRPRPQAAPRLRVP